MKKKKKVKRMEAVVIPLPRKNNNILSTDWLNQHFGCDVDKLMNGDTKERNKTIKHFEKETLILRSRLDD